MEIEFRSGNLKVIAVRLVSHGNRTVRHNVFVTGEDRALGHVVVPAEVMKHSGTMQVWLILWWSSPGGWLYGQDLGTVPAHAFSARGNFGQIVAVVPSEQVVVVLVNDKRVDGQAATPGGVRNELFERIFAAKR